MHFKFNNLSTDVHISDSADSLQSHQQLEDFFPVFFSVQELELDKA